MRSISIAAILTLLPLALTTPISDPTINSLRADLHRRQLCDIVTPGQTCAGAELKDVIIQFPQKVAQDDVTILRDVVTDAGGKMLYDWQERGFSAYVPEKVLKLMQAHGAKFGMSVHENACAEIPWCGEAPC